MSSAKVGPANCAVSEPAAANASSSVVCWYGVSMPASYALLLFRSQYTVTAPVAKSISSDEALWMPPRSPTSTSSMYTHTSSSPEKL